MITIEIHDWEDIESLMQIFQQIGHHFVCECEEEQCEDGCS
jgi:hypothetical protein